MKEDKLSSSESRDFGTPPSPNKDVRSSKLRSRVLAIGLVEATLTVSGLAAYTVIQVPTLRAWLGFYYTEDGPDKVASLHERPKAEVIGVMLAGTLGLLINLLLVIGAIKNIRYFLLPWITIHLALWNILCFLAFFVFFLTPWSWLWKLSYLIPVAIGMLIVLVTDQVYELYSGKSFFDKRPPPPTPDPFLAQRLEKSEGPVCQPTLDSAVRTCGPGHCMWCKTHSRRLSYY